MVRFDSLAQSLGFMVCSIGLWYALYYVLFVMLDDTMVDVPCKIRDWDFIESDNLEHIPGVVNSRPMMGVEIERAYLPDLPPGHPVEASAVLFSNSKCFDLPSCERFFNLEKGQSTTCFFSPDSAPTPTSLSLLSLQHETSRNQRIFLFGVFSLSTGAPCWTLLGIGFLFMSFSKKRLNFWEKWRCSVKQPSSKHV